VSQDQSFRSVLGDLAFLGLIGFLAKTHAISESPIVLLLGMYATGRFGIKMHKEGLAAVVGGGSGASGRYPAVRPPDGPSPPPIGGSGERRATLPGESPATRPGSYRGPEARRWALEWAPTLGAFVLALYVALSAERPVRAEPRPMAGAAHVVVGMLP
jgi:hypothetical protein